MDNTEATKDGGRLPLTRSLEAEVLATFIAEEHHGGLDDTDLVAALAQISLDHSPLLDALSNANQEYPNSNSAAILRWVDATFLCWQNQATLAPEARQIVNRSRSLAAAFALTDSRFFTPGGHGLHRLLDLLYDFFKGWHPGLGGNAQSMLATATEIIERIQVDFPSESQVDETRILVEPRVHRHEEKLKQLEPLLLERELKNLGEDAIRQAAAWLINIGINQTALPESVAQFITSDWYESGVCIAIQHGFDSGQWRTFIDTTQLLVDAVQPVSPTDGNEVHRLYMTMQQISITLSQQLVSLQDDTEAVASAVGLIEYAMLRNVRGEDLGLQEVDPIAGGSGDNLPIADNDLTALDLKPGNRFLMQTTEGAIRLRFVGTLINNYYLLFMDLHGNRALRKSTHEFRTLINSGEIRCLEAQDSFCLAMTRAIELRQKHNIEANAQPDPTPSPIDNKPAQHDQTNLPKYENETQVQHDAEAAGHWPPPQKTTDHPPPTSIDTGYDPNTVIKLQIPMGTWLGFHDRDPPLMAKVVASDLEKNSYIFTNRDGIKMRELTVPQLVALIDRNMVDILERKTNFRETASQLFQQQERIDKRPQ